MKGQYVLENKLGQVVRTFHGESDEINVVLLKETGRIEAFPSIQDLDDNEIPYLALVKTSPRELKKKAVAVGSVGTLRWCDEVEKVTPHIFVEKDDTKDFKKILKWTAGIEVALLLLLLLIGHFMTSKIDTQEPQLVTIVPRPPEVQKRVVKPHPIVEVTEHKITKKVVTPQITHHKVRKVVHLRTNPKHAQRTYAVHPNRAGHPNVLGILEKANQQGGLNLSGMKTSQGIGLGGTEGSGGLQTSLYGRGLMASPLGPQARANGAGGYGTYGKGGGHAGYGRMSLVGSSSGFFQPLESEEKVEGGLDREEIAAVIQRHLGQIRFCYEEGLQVKANLNGRVAIRFFINPSGYVSAANVSSTSMHSNGVEGCIVSKLKSWKFPEPRGGVIVKVTYPFVLKRVSQS